MLFLCLLKIYAIFAEKSKLKKYIAIVLFLVLAVRPMYHLAQVVYYELNIDYIIENYCINTDKPELQCNGKCHLAKQLQVDAQADSSNNDVNTIAVLECFYSIFNNAQTYDIFPTPQITPSEKSKILSYDKIYSFLRASSLFRPPMC